MCGVIAVQGDIGTIQTNSLGDAVTVNNALIRFGGISATGGVGGQIVAVGNVFGEEISTSRAD